MQNPNKIVIERTEDFTGFPLISGNISFSKIKTSEPLVRSNGSHEAYVIDNENSLKLLLERIRLLSDESSNKSLIPAINFNTNTVLAYLFIGTTTAGNKYKIKKIEGVPNTSTIFMTIEFVVGILDALSTPYLIISIPKTSYKTVTFEV